MFQLVYYSPTGNTKFLANELAQKLNINESIYPLEFTDPNSLVQTDHLVLMFPIHGFNPPRTVYRFVNKIADKHYKKVTLIAVGCNELWSNDAVFERLKKKFSKKDIQVLSTEILAMPITIVIDFKEDMKKDMIFKATNRINTIALKIKNGDVESKNVKLRSKFISLIGKLENPASRLFGLELHANKNCTSCGICVKNCPESNIKFNKKMKPKFGLRCSMCMRCIYSCPDKAISPIFSKFLTIKNGYHLKTEDIKK